MALQSECQQTNQQMDNIQTNGVKTVKHSLNRQIQKLIIYNKQEQQKEIVQSLIQQCYCKINQFISVIRLDQREDQIKLNNLKNMNDYKIMLNKHHQQYLAKMLPKGYSFELYKVRKNIINYPYKEFDKKYKKNQSIILNKIDSLVIDSIEQSDLSFKQKSQPAPIKEHLTKIQYDLLTLTKKLRRLESSYPFRIPVDPKALQVPDYFDVILEPIDLKTIQDKIRRDEYEHVAEFQRDIYKMIMNSYKYNQKASTTEKKTREFEESYVQIMREFHKQKTHQQNGDKELVKEQMVDQKSQSEEVRKPQAQKEQPPQQCKQVAPQEPHVNLFVAANIVKQQPPPKQNPQLVKAMTETATQKPRVSKKQLPKPISASHIPKPKSPKKSQPKVKKQQLEDDLSQFSLPLNELVFSQQIQPTCEKDLQEEQIKDQMKSYLENETQNNKEQNFSEGYNEAAFGGKIKSTEVQKQITSLLKRLSEFPLTKQKKIKNFSKFTNLEQNMTQTDKKKLFDRIKKLDQNDIEYVVRILTKGKCDTSKVDQYQIDLDKADSKVLREVQNFIALRDQSFAANNTSEMNGSMTLSLPPQPVSAEVLKIPKKVKKEEKKIVKKKMSRKNSNDDSFSLNPPTIKKRKSQKPHKKSAKGGGEDKSQINGDDKKSMLDDRQESSSYHPQPLHHQHQGKVHGSNLHNKSMEIEKVNHNSQKPTIEREKKHIIEQTKQKVIEQTPRLPYHQPQIIHHQQHSPQQYHHHQEDKYDDIDQFLAISSKFDNEPHEDIPFSMSNNRSSRKQFHTIEPLDFMDLHNFAIGNPNVKDYPDEEMKDFSIYQPQKEQNDEDHFF